MSVGSRLIALCQDCRIASRLLLRCFATAASSTLISPMKDSHTLRGVWNLVCRFSTCLDRRRPSQWGRSANFTLQRDGAEPQYTMLPTDVPPQTNNVWPVTNEDIRFSKKPHRARDIDRRAEATHGDLARCRSHFRTVRRNDLLEHLGIRDGPGATTLTVMPCGASSRAQVRAKPNMPAFVDEYAVRFASPSTARLEINTIRPLCACFIAADSPAPATARRRGAGLRARQVSRCSVPRSAFRGWRPHSERWWLRASSAARARPRARVARIGEIDHD